MKHWFEFSEQFRKIERFPLIGSHGHPRGLKVVTKTTTLVASIVCGSSRVSVLSLLAVMSNQDHLIVRIAECLINYSSGIQNWFAKFEIHCFSSWKKNCWLSIFNGGSFKSQTLMKKGLPIIYAKNWQGGVRKFLLIQSLIRRLSCELEVDKAWARAQRPGCYA